MTSLAISSRARSIAVPYIRVALDGLESSLSFHLHTSIIEHIVFSIFRMEKEQPRQLNSPVEVT